MKGLNPNDKIEDLYIESPPSQSILHHASKGASRAESIEQLTEESDQNQPTVDLDLADRRSAGWGTLLHGC